MTDDTSRPVAAVDRRTARRLAIAEQQHRDADAELERRGRAALQELELAEARRVAVQRRLETRRRRVLGRRSARKGRRSARRAGLRAAAPRLAERALFVGPILFPMAVAWIGQIQYARTIMGWPLPGAVVFAAGFELSTVYVARLDWKARGEGDNGLVFRVATWLFAALAATMNYWHAADPGLRPNGEAVSYGAMSVAGVVLWELLSTYRHRGRLRAAGTLPPRRPRFGLARWIWFPRITHLARLLALRDGHTLTERAWQTALDAADRHGSVRAAIATLRGRQRIAAASSASGQLPAETFDETTRSSRGETGVETVGETSGQIAVATRVETSSARTPRPLTRWTPRRPSTAKSRRGSRVPVRSARRCTRSGSSRPHPPRRRSSATATADRSRPAARSSWRRPSAESRRGSGSWRPGTVVGCLGGRPESKRR